MAKAILRREEPGRTVTFGSDGEKEVKMVDKATLQIEGSGKREEPEAGKQIIKESKAAQEDGKPTVDKESLKKSNETPESDGLEVKKEADAEMVAPEATEEAKKERKKRRRQIREIRSFFLRLLFMAIFLYALFFVVFGMKPMPNEDMKPRISAGDLLLYYRLEKRYYPNDVVVLEKDGRSYVGRISALPGDEVEIPEAGGLRINGNTVLEADIFYPTEGYETDKVQYPVKLGEGQYFLLCDHRSGAKDSRFYGVVERSELRGKVITILRRSNL